jgi:hypothetical protein
MAKKTTKTEKNIQAVEEALSKSERFIVENQKPITYILVALIALVLISFITRSISISIIWIWHHIDTI